ncbi:hypothetical protein DFJ73DRAFT_646498 [Zopfochytrium polystomum]|nr:hypothetical protein DFJ73DRAFT_646498 [Zopfochytrium polystomum]
MASSGGFAPSAPPPQTPAPAPAHGGSSRLASSHLAVPSSSSSSSSPFSSSSSSSTSLSHTATHPSIQFASRSPSVASASSPRSVDGPPTLVPADAPSACHAGPSPSPSSNSAPSLAQRKHQRSSPSLPSQSSPAPPLPSPCPSTAAPPAATDAPPSPADLPPIGSLIVSQSGSQYILTQKKGQGSFSTVYVATCIEPPSITRFRTRKSLVKEEVLAIKCVARLQQSPTVQVRRECQLLELLQAPSAASALPGSYVKTSQISDATMENDSEGCGHEGVVHMFEVFETPDFLFLVLEFCQIDLYQFVVDNGGFPTHVVKRIFTQLIDAVDFCHTRGVFHRDIKPENVLVNTSDCSIRLTDFGLATQEPWSYEVGVGSLRYMSPECFGIELHTIQGRRPTPGDDPLDPNLGAARRPGFASGPNDVWSLGIVLINLLYSRNPWRSPADPFCSEAYLRDRLPVLQTHFAISHELDAFLRRCFDAVPERRATVRQLRRLFSGVKDLVDPIAAVALGLGAMPVVRDLLPAVATSRSGAAGDGLAAFAFGILAGKNGSSGTSRDEKEKKRAAERKKRTAASTMSVDVNDMNGEFIPSASTMSASSSSSSSASSSSSDGDNPFQSRSVRGSRGGGSFIGPSGVLFDVSPAEPGVQAFPPLFTPQDAQPNRRFSSVFPAPNLDRRRSNSSLGISSHALPQPNNSVGNKVSSLAQLLRDARPQQIAPSHYFDPNSPPTSTLASPLPSPLPYRGGAAGASFGAWDGTLFSVEDSFRTSMITPPPRLDPTTPLTPLRRVSLGDALLIAGRRSSTSTDGRNPYGGADPRLAAVAAAAAAASSAGLFGPVSPSEEEPPVYSRPLPAMNPKGSVHRRFSKIEPQPAAAHQHLPFTLAIPVPKFRQRQQPLPHPGPPRLASEDSALAPPLMSKSLTPDLEDSTSTATQAGSPFSASPSTLSPASTRSQDRRASASSSLQTLSPYRVAATRSPVISTTPAFPFPPGCCLRRWSSVKHCVVDGSAASPRLAPAPFGPLLPPTCCQSPA